MINRNRRTLSLALLATLTLVWSAIVYFEIPAEEMAWMALYSAAGVFGIMLLAALFVAAVQLLKYLLARLRGSGQDADST